MEWVKITEVEKEPVEKLVNMYHKEIWDHTSLDTDKSLKELIKMINVRTVPEGKKDGFKPNGIPPRSKECV
ncbi:MAG: hypothetical protein ACW99Q_27230 [Candidatus Kariarchaeaceae archaeon]|jgi:hypothetical protein